MAKGCPGPDGVSLALLKSMPCCVLARVLNLLMLCRDLPPFFKRSKTVLLPKVEEPKDPSDFRPISISSVVVRLYHKILALRIVKGCHIELPQRGFMPVDGCAENSAILQAIINDATESYSSAFIASLDIKNAFGSVSHVALIEALKMNGAPPVLVDYVRNLYTGYSTEIVLGTDVKVAYIKRGCLQGCGLSPILFNFVINQVLRKMPQDVGCAVGTTEDRCLVDSAAFADDLLTFASTYSGIYRQLKCLDEVSPKFGLIFNPKKCCYLAIVGKKKDRKIKVETGLDLKLQGENLRGIEVLQEFKYLGMLYSVQGVKPIKLLLRPLLERLGKAALKPQQKLEVLKTFLIPRLMYQLQMGKMYVGLYNAIDLEIRKWVGRLLKLPPSSPTSFYYAPVRAGGLGILRMRVSIPQMVFLRLKRLARSSSVHARAASTSKIIERRVQKAESMIMEYEDSKGKLHKVIGAASVQRFLARELYRTVDGSALAQADKAPIAHAWVGSHGHMLTGQNYIFSVKIRINAMPVLSRTLRGYSSPRLCRGGCRDCIETLDHVLGRCQVTRGATVDRHNKLCARLSSFGLQLGYKVLDEPRIPLSAETTTLTGCKYFKPDLIMIREGRVAVIDALVCGAQYNLKKCHAEKVKKYDIPDVKSYCDSLGTEQYSVGTVVFNNRGILARDSERMLLSLGFNKGMIRTLAVACMEGSIAIWNCWTRKSGTHWRRCRE